MRTTTVLISFFCLALAPGATYAQAVEGLVADFTDTEQEIIVTGERPEEPLPLPYEAYVFQNGGIVTTERDATGRTYFTYTRPLFGDVEFHREWNDGSGHPLIPELNSPDTRWVPWRW